jgi:hypothetical protein
VNGGEKAFKLGKLFLQEIAWAVAARKEKVFTTVKFHDLKATFITNLLERGESLARVDVQDGTNKLGYKVPKVENADVISLFERKNMK